MPLKNKRSLVFPTLLVVFAIMIASGACSQHNPGNFQGGGREMPTSEIEQTGSNPPPPDSGGPIDNSVPDIFTPPQDSSTEGG